MMTRRTAIKTGALAGIALAALPRAIAQANPSTPSSTGADADSASQLAAQIRADSTLSEVHHKAQELLKSGLNAGSGYDQVWIRDTNTFIEVALEVNPPQRFREALLNFFKFQGDKGDIVDGYRRWDPKAARTARLSLLAPDFMAFKNGVETDQESSLVQAIFKYVTVTNDNTILDETVAGVSVRDRLVRALTYVLTERFDHKHGLVWGGTRADWGDVQPEDSPGVTLDAMSHRALTIYDSAMLLIALNDYLQLVGEDGSSARHLRRAHDKLKRNARKHLWDTKNRKFIPHLYLDGSPFPKDFDENAIYYHGGTAVAIEAGLLTRDEVLGALQRMEANVQAANASSIGLTMYRPYPNGFFKNPQLTKPYTYQNGGDWCWFGGRMVQQLVEYGYAAEAYRALQPMVQRVVRVGDFHEWWSRDNQPKGSGGFRGSAGVLGKAIEMLQAWAEQDHTRDQPTVTL
jgi:Amylo-alpha-1,6-glucosidase